MEQLKLLSQFLFEMGHLRRVKHEGWRLAQVERPDSVAEHSLRAAQIAYILAHLESYPNPSEAAAALVFHDCHETRIGDLHKLARRYVEADEDRAAREQLEPLGGVGQAIYDLWRQVEVREPPLGDILKDADYLECAFTGKEYLERGYAEAQDWITNVGQALRTESAKRLFAAMRETTSTAWWHGLKKLT